MRKDAQCEGQAKKKSPQITFKSSRLDYINNVTRIEFYKECVSDLDQSYNGGASQSVCPAEITNTTAGRFSY